MDPSTDRYTVPTTTLENILAVNQIEKCDFMKINCEGIEHDVIAATPPETFARIERLSVEVETVDKQKNMRSLSALLKDRGYTIDTGGRGKNVIYAVRA